MSIAPVLAAFQIPYPSDWQSGQPCDYDRSRDEHRACCSACSFPHCNINCLQSTSCTLLHNALELKGVFGKQGLVCSHMADKSWLIEFAALGNFCKQDEWLVTCGAPGERGEAGDQRGDDCSRAGHSVQRTGAAGHEPQRWHVCGRAHWPMVYQLWRGWVEGRYQACLTTSLLRFDWRPHAREVRALHVFQGWNHVIRA